ncbi:single-stranded DNA-binding protein [Brevibacillus brevis]|uniref:Single-stranded DNA-binding protein n=1 Tax=Brevibacillus brevis TaxID=1393 RepID=A0ABY9TC36_BREBE|nr:single-stranded DNA-binding protein [Brevibacillus brevis]WNC17621.1 single-stranded DNA-binding protein [Brevibacillus brevis]
MRYTTSGIAVTTFTLAVNRPYANQEGERQADFINIVTWQKLADLCANYLRKGRQVGVEGRLQTRSYENQEGRKVYVTEVVADRAYFLDKAQDDQANNPHSNHDPFASADPFADPFGGSGKPIHITDDDLPF